MILVDTNVLVALADERDQLHARATRDLGRLQGPYALSSVVLAEAFFLLPERHLRLRVQHLVERLPLSFVEIAGASWPAVFAWLQRFVEHEPDLCDGQLCTLATELDASIWSYDAEFRTMWRGPNGSRLKIVPEPTRGGSRARRPGRRAR